jgi:hypothetical protein
VKFFVVFAVVALAFLGVRTMLDGQAPGSPGTPSACGGSFTVLVNGQPLPNAISGCVLNLQSGNGVIAAAAPDPSIGGTDITFSYNSALIATIPQAEQGVSYCNSQTGTTAYACVLPFALTTLQRGMEVLLSIDTPCPTSCTLSFSTITGAIAIKQANGTTDPMGTGFLGTAGQAGRIWFDGTVFRLE